MYEFCKGREKQRLVVGADSNPSFEVKGQSVEKTFRCWARSILSENGGGDVTGTAISQSRDWEMEVFW